MPKGDCVITESAEVRIARIDERIEDMYGRLFGNGQKGVVQVHDEAISILKAWKNKMIGALGVITFALGIIGTKLMGFW
jgi:hypothetical protein